MTQATILNTIINWRQKKDVDEDASNEVARKKTEETRYGCCEDLYQLFLHW